MDLNDKLKAEAPAAESGSKTVGETSKRILECQLKDYCKTKLNENGYINTNRDFQLGTRARSL